MTLQWKDCPEKDCTNKVCLALNSDKCFVHTKGNRRWKLLKITIRNLYRKYVYTFSRT